MNNFYNEAISKNRIEPFTNLRVYSFASFS